MGLDSPGYTGQKNTTKEYTKIIFHNTLLWRNDRYAIKATPIKINSFTDFAWKSKNFDLKNKKTWET